MWQDVIAPINRLNKTILQFKILLLSVKMCFNYAPQKLDTESMMNPKEGF